MALTSASSLSIKDLFQSTTRMRDLYLNFFPDEFEDFVERWDNAEFVEVELTALGWKILRNESWPWKLEGIRLVCGRNDCVDGR